MIAQLSSGTLLGPYELLLPLPRTGAAQVWVARLARAGGFRSHVALKTIPRGYFDDVPTEHLLLEQAALATRIHHPNLVETLDLGEQDDTLYLAMEWVDGEPLQAVVAAAGRQGGVPLPIAVNLVGQLCRGLHAIHEQGDAEGAPASAVHGHISLQNLVLGYNGTAKLCDFGIARAMDRLSFLTSAHERNHKLTFAAPEQLDSRPVDRRSDVFSAGTLLYLLTTSRHPFAGASMRATLNNVCSSQPALPPGLDCPEALRHVLSKALRKAPDERWSSALELGNALENAMPESFQSSSEQTLEEYLDQLCGAHRLEFHTHMRDVEARCDSDASVPVEPASTIPGSLRGVSLDSIADFVSQPPGWYAKAKHLIANPFGFALLSIFACCLALGLGFASRSGNAPRATLASQPGAPTAGVERLPEPRAGAAASPGASVSPAQAVDSSEPPRAPSPAASLAPAARVSPPPRSSPRGVASTSRSAAPAAASRVEPGAASPKVDAWDPSTFGGRY